MVLSYVRDSVSVGGKDLFDSGALEGSSASDVVCNGHLVMWNIYFISTNRSSVITDTYVYLRSET
jgi:hypothetical protein